MNPAQTPDDMPDSAPQPVAVRSVAFLLNGQAGSCDAGTATALIEKLGAEHGVDVRVTDVNGTRLGRTVAAEQAHPRNPRVTRAIPA